MAFSLFGKRDKSDQQPDQPTNVAMAEPQEQKRGFFDRMKQAVTRTRESFSESISSVIALTREVDETTLVGLEPILLAADLGPPATPPEVIMMVGVNGTGKTTTTGKLAAHFTAQGRTVLLCAADTFRAAAIEQLEVWAQRSDVQIIKTKQGGDPSAALYDACAAAKARGTQVLI